jgi:hypothetical protein
VIAILLLNQGCAALEVGIPPFTGKFEHCARAAAAGDGAKSALLNLGLSEDLASTTGKTVEKAVVDALDRGESPEEVARAATVAVIKEAEEASATSSESSDGEESTLFGRDEESTLFGRDEEEPPEEVGQQEISPVEPTEEVSPLVEPPGERRDTVNAVIAAAGAAAAAAAASNSVGSAAPAAKVAAVSAAEGKDGLTAEQNALESGLPEDVAKAAGTGTEIGIREEARLSQQVEPPDEEPPEEVGQQVEPPEEVGQQVEPPEEEPPEEEPPEEEPPEEEPPEELFQ